MNNQFNKINRTLQQSGYKLTPQREMVVSVILEKEEDHLSAEEIFLYVKRKNADIGLATVYRTLEILVDLKIVDRVSFTDDGVVLYDLRKNTTSHFHSHLVCQTCGCVEEVEEDLLLSVEDVVKKKFGFFVKDHRLTFHGICKKCQKLENGTEK